MLIMHAAKDVACQVCETVPYLLFTLLWNIPWGIEMVNSVFTGLLGEEGRVSTSVDTRL